jgi:hypothetical protein
MLRGLWGTGPQNVYAAGDSGKIVRYGGAGRGWVKHCLGTTGSVSGIWMASDTQAFAATDDGQMLHWDGATWEPMTVPAGLSFSGLWGASPTDVFATTYGFEIHRYDGSSWQLASPTHGCNWAVHGVSASAVFAVGDSSCAVAFDGTSWRRIIDYIGNYPQYGVWAASPTDVFSAGRWGLIRRWDGSQWTSMISPGTYGLEGIGGRSADAVWAVGFGGTILHYDGNPANEWVSQESATAAGLYGVWASPEGDAFVSGDGGLVLWWDGEQWSPMESGTVEPLHVIHGISRRHVMAGGKNGTLLEFTGDLPRRAH